MEMVDRVMVVVGMSGDRIMTTWVVVGQWEAVGRLPKERMQVVTVVHPLARAQRRLEKRQAAVNLGLVMNRVVMGQREVVGSLPKERTQVVKVVHTLPRAQRRLEKRQVAVNLGLMMNRVVGLLARPDLPRLKPFV